MTAEQLEELLGRVTRGPWLRSKVRAGRVVVCQQQHTIGTAHARPMPSTPAEADANATLMALAPSLARRVIAAEAAESQLAEERALSDRLAASYAMSLNDKAKVKACPSLAAYRKARGL